MSGFLNLQKNDTESNIYLAYPKPKVIANLIFKFRGIKEQIMTHQPVKQDITLDTFYWNLSGPDQNRTNHYFKHCEVLNF
jgi:hypothetical protein